jgi:signal transduction histidine kinase
VREHRVALIGLAGALAFGLEWLGYAGESIGLAAADLVVGVTFFACGLAVWRPGRRDPMALLFLAIGLTWFLGTPAGSDHGSLAAIGATLLFAHRGPFLQLVLSYPTGRPRSYPTGRPAFRAGWIVVAAAYVDGLVVSLAENDTLTIVLAGGAVFMAALGVRGADLTSRAARKRAAACAALVAAALVLGSVSRLSGGGISDTALLLVYEAALLVSALVLTLGLLADRSRPARVADLVVELGADAGSETLRGALARAYADPSLELGFWVGDAYVDDQGRRLVLPTEGEARRATLVELDGEPLAAFAHDAATAHDPGLDDAVTVALRLAAANTRLQAELLSQVGELRASRRRMIDAGDAQRVRLERRLSQAADVQLEAMRLALERALVAAPPEVMQAIQLVQREREQAVVEVHQLALGIHPRTLSERGLGAALAELAETAPTPVSVVAPGDRFPHAAEVAAYFVCAEALANVAKYARAERAAIDVQRRDGLLRVLVSDDGIGGADPARGSGLRGLADRVDAVGGSLTMTSPPAGGTSVCAEIPVERFA